MHFCDGIVHSLVTCFVPDLFVSSRGTGVYTQEVRVQAHLHLIFMTASGPVQYLSGSLELCQRCKERLAVLISRKERFCGACFVFFMRGKQRKQMLDERYKVKYGAVAERLGTQRVLLPLSFGASSLTLLDMIASLLQEQNLAHHGKQGFDLVVLHLHEDGETATSQDFEDFHQLARKYEPVHIKFMLVSVDDIVVDERMRISVNSEFNVLAQLLLPNDATRSLTITQLLERAPSKSLRVDLLALLYEEVIFRTAVAEQCQTVIFGHSMTRLASEVISLTVKGRGLTIYRQINDGPRQCDSHIVHVIHPLRDILYAEVEAVLTFCDGLDQYVRATEPVSRIVKNMTVNALTTQYFDNLDLTGYSSTASTVVKTAEKLGGPREAKIGECRVCGDDIHQDAHQWLRNITVSSPAPVNTDEERQYVKLYESQVHMTDVTGTSLTVCYGCTVMLAGAGPEFVWPVRELKQEVLDEYVLTDDEP